MADSSELWDNFETRLRASWERGEPLGVETLLHQCDATRIDDAMYLKLILGEFRLRQKLGKQPDIQEFTNRFPQYADRLLRLIGEDDSLDTRINPTSRPVFAKGPHSPPDYRSASSLIGGQKLGPYEVLEKLGQGGMGAVYKARHLKLNKLAAIKVLPPQCMENPQAVARFEREMLAVGKVQHANLVRAMDAGEYHGIHYLAMEYFDGCDLQRVVRDQGLLSVPEAANAIWQVALGLKEVHELGLVHRDIKPSNLLRTSRGEMKILDLGLSWLTHDESVASLTDTGQVLGTPDYMSPEQWDEAHDVDGRADLYALGCVLFYLLIGRAPFDDGRHRSVVSKMKAHVKDAPPEIASLRADVPSELAAIYRRLMEKEPEARFATAAELAQALQPFVASDVASSGSERSLSKPSSSSEVDPANAATVAHVEQPDPAGRSGMSPPHRRGNRIALAAFGAAVIVLLSVLIIRIKAKDGTTTEITVPEGSSIEITGLKPAAETNPAATAPSTSPSEKRPADFTNKMGMEFMLVGKGTGWLGGSNGQPATKKVEIPQDFYIGKYEVTQGEWLAVTGTNRSSYSRHGYGSEKVKDIPDEELLRFPAESMTWAEAQQFVTSLNKLDSHPEWTYRLPTPVEWEYACRGGPNSDINNSAFDFYFAQPTNELSPGQASFAPITGQGLRRTSKVGSYSPNRLGLFDMHGNVWEWTEESEPDQEGALQFVFLGGCWGDDAHGCRATSRSKLPPSTRHDFLGLRLVRTPIAKE